ncbi:MAG TPA: hypothetical protein VGB57_07880 [Allosphingosinicella sp.]|jgi:hypothetical protein
MRIILSLAAGVGAMAITAAAPAKPGPEAFNGGGGQPGWSRGGGENAGGGLYFRHAPSGIRGYRGQGRQGRHGRFGRHGRDGYSSYGVFGIGGPAGAVDPWGNGFFNGGGGRIRLHGDRPHYDYDRSYPYEWAPAAGGGEDREDAAGPGASERTPRCTFENGVRVCRGW